MIDEALLRHYADLKNEEREVKKQIEDVKVKVLGQLQAAGAHEIVIADIGKVVLVPKRSWKYPPHVVKLEEELKKAKEVAESKGEATYVDSPFVRFDPLKASKE